MFTKQDVVNALNLFEMLEHGQGKVAGATVARSVVSQYVKARLAEAQPEKRHFSTKEINEMRAGNKLNAVKMVKDRLGLSLMDAKHYVEQKGGKELAKSGKYDGLGNCLYPPNLG